MDRPSSRLRKAKFAKCSVNCNVIHSMVCRNPIPSWYDPSTADRRFLLFHILPTSLVLVVHAQSRRRWSNLHSYLVTQLSTPTSFIIHCSAWSPRWSCSSRPYSGARWLWDYRHSSYHGGILPCSTLPTNMWVRAWDWIISWLVTCIERMRFSDVSFLVFGHNPNNTP